MKIASAYLLKSRISVKPAMGYLKLEIATILMHLTKFGMKNVCSQKKPPTALRSKT